MAWQGRGRAKLRKAILHLCPEPETLRPGLWCSLSSDLLPTQTACTRPQTWATLPPAAALEGHPLILRSPESHHHPSQSSPKPLAVGQRVPLQMKCHVISFPSLNITDVRQTSSSQNNLWLLDHLAGIYVESLMEFLIYFVFIFSPSHYSEMYFLDLRLAVKTALRKNGTFCKT